MIAPAYDVPSPDSHLWPTYVMAAKCRTDMSVTRYASLLPLQHAPEQNLRRRLHARTPDRRWPPVRRAHAVGAAVLVEGSQPERGDVPMIRIPLEHLPSHKESPVWHLVVGASVAFVVVVFVAGVASAQGWRFRCGQARRLSARVRATRVRRPSWGLRVAGLSLLDDSSVDAMVTDPPAGIGFMGRDWDSNKGGRTSWVAWMTGVMEGCLRVMKPGAHGVVWALPRTSHWTATALEQAGFEVRDVITHHFGTGFPKSLSVAKASIDRIESRHGSATCVCVDGGSGFVVGQDVGRGGSSPDRVHGERSKGSPSQAGNPDIPIDAGSDEGSVRKLRGRDATEDARPGQVEATCFAHGAARTRDRSAGTRRRSDTVRAGRTAGPRSERGTRSAERAG